MGLRFQRAALYTTQGIWTLVQGQWGVIEGLSMGKDMLQFVLWVDCSNRVEKAELGRPHSLSNE